MGFSNKPKFPEELYMLISPWGKTQDVYNITCIFLYYVSVSILDPLQVLEHCFSTKQIQLVRKKSH